MSHRNNNNNNSQPKSSGATYSKIKKHKDKDYIGGTIINAWNFSKSKGLITVTISPYSKTKTYTAKSTGNKYQTMVAKVHYHRSGVTRILACSMNLETRVVGIQELKMCVTPNGSGLTKSGKNVKGYFGKYLNK